MKPIVLPLFLPLLLVACAPSAPPTNTDAAATTAAAAPAPAATGSATGTVEAVDFAAGTVTIAHGPVPALKWPPMTMTFKAGTVDLRSITKGQRVSFVFTSNNATLVSIKPE